MVHHNVKSSCQSKNDILHDHSDIFSAGLHKSLNPTIRIRARRVSCEHVENMELRCALCLISGEVAYVLVLITFEILAAERLPINEI